MSVIRAIEGGGGVVIAALLLLALLVAIGRRAS